MIVQTSCSELLVDTDIHNAGEAFTKFRDVFDACEWSCSPELSMKLLQSMIDAHTHNRTLSNDDWESQVTVSAEVYDAKGNRAALLYGDNGYYDSGFRFDSECSDGDVKCYPIFREAIERLHGKLVACDGGHTEMYEEWVANPEAYAERWG